MQGVSLRQVRSMRTSSRSSQTTLGYHPHPTTAVLGRSYRPLSVRVWRSTCHDCGTRPRACQTLAKTA